MALSDEASRMRIARNEGIRITVELLKESNFSKEEVLDKILKKYDISPEKLEQLVEEYWNA